MNRISSIASLTDIDQRIDSYRRLRPADSKINLSLDEINSAIKQFRVEHNFDVKVSLWNLLLEQPCNDLIINFCEDWLTNILNTERSRALRILRKCQPEKKRMFYERYANDHSLMVRYESLLCLYDTHQQKATIGIVDILYDLSRDFQDEAEQYIDNALSPQVIERIRLNAKLRGEQSVYARLEAVVRQNPRSST